MNKTWIIIQREFINRVSKKSFILLTILMPFIFAALIFVPLWLSTVKGGDQKQVAIIDATMKYLPQFKDDESWHFVGVPQMEASFRSDSTQFDAVVEIKADLAEHPEAVTIYSRKEVPNSLSRLVSETLDEQVRQDKLLHYDIPQLPSIMQDVNRKLNIRTVKWGEDGSESESNAGAAMAAGMVLTLLIYMFVMSYGGMVMQSVMEEKTNRIVEVIVSSVKPFQLMIGKIIGIGLVGVAQLAIWAVLIIVLLAVAGGISGSSPELMGGASGLLATLQGLNLAKMGGLFVLNFIGGYLVYASIFAAIDAAINGQEDSQQFMMPIVLLLIFALYAGIYSSDNPDGPLAIWCSMIPFTSPIVMMVRLPFDVPVWETMLSVVILYVAAFGMIGIAGKIYRVGILMYGKKPSFKEMIRWITYK